MLRPASLLLSLGLAAARPAHAASSTYEGDFEPTSPAQVTEFCATHDGVSGDLRIGPGWGATDLSLLACVAHIGGSLVLDRAPMLETTRGLTGLAPDTVVVRTVIKGNPSLTELGPGLPRTRDLVIAENTILQTVSALPRAVSGGRYVVTANPELQRFEGPEARSGTRLAGVSFAGNPRLQAVTGFRGVDEIEGLSLTGNDALTTLEGPRIRRAGAVTVADAPVEDLPLLDRLEVAQSLTLHALPRLPAVPELYELSRIGRLYIDGCRALGSVDGLAANRSQRPVLDAAVLRGNRVLPSDHAEQILAMLARGTDPGKVVVIANGPRAGDLAPGVPGGRR